MLIKINKKITFYFNFHFILFFIVYPPPQYFATLFGLNYPFFIFYAEIVEERRKREKKGGEGK